MTIQGDRRLTRREFMRRSAGLTATALLAACGGDESPTATPVPGPAVFPSPTTTGRPGDMPSAPTATSVPAGTPRSGSPAGSPAAAGAGAGGVEQVGVVTSLSGPLQLYAEQYLTGLGIGLDYATGGARVAGGQRIEYEVRDDGGDPEQAVRLARELIDQGYRILAGPVNSDVALRLLPLVDERRVLFVSGPAAADGITGRNRYTFRSGRHSYQDVLAAKALLPATRDKAILVLAPDTAFGQAEAASVQSVFIPEGAMVERRLVPASTREFASVAQELRNRRPDFLFLAWAGTTTDDVLNALDREDVLGRLSLVTGLAQRQFYPNLGPAAERLTLFAHYLPGAPQNPANQLLVDHIRQRSNTPPGLFAPDGFVAGQLLARAIGAAGGPDVDRMIDALEGYAFTGPKGQYTVRREDHALLQPMFGARLVRQGPGYEAEPIRTLAPDEVAPPLNPIPR